MRMDTVVSTSLNQTPNNHHHHHLYEERQYVRERGDFSNVNVQCMCGVIHHCRFATSTTRGGRLLAYHAHARPHSTASIDQEFFLSQAHNCIDNQFNCKFLLARFVLGRGVVVRRCRSSSFVSSTIALYFFTCDVCVLVWLATSFTLDINHH